MKVEWRPIVHFTKAEARKVEDARLILYKTSNRGPWFGNPHPEAMCWNHKGAAGYWDLRYTESALTFELEHWSSVPKRERTRQYLARFDEPTVAVVIRKLRSALTIVERALDLCGSDQERKAI